MNEQLPRSPYDMVGGLVYFPRLLDKIRLHARGDLPEAYQSNLGRELDGYGLGRLDRWCWTRFDFIEFDEGRTPPDFRQWELPRQG